MRNYKRRSQGKGEITGKKRVFARYLNPSPLETSPSWAKFVHSTYRDFMRQGKIALYV
jgi:hypothetical protein